MNLSTTEIWSIVLGLIGTVTGILGFAIGFISIRFRKYDILSDYFSEIGSKELIESRKKIYNSEGEDLTFDIDASLIINFYDRCGFLVFRHYLSFKTFNSYSGFSVVKLYEILLPVLNERRKDNPGYARYFKSLYEKIKKKTN
ncbi:MAG: hypothetical protein WCN92_10450 [Eubacteriales bacterium]